MPTDPLELLLGFDAREMWLGTSELLHPSHDRSTFLLRDDVEKVFSADILVWPSLFGASFPRAAERPSLEAPRWIGANPPFWEDLAALEQSIPRNVAQPYAIIAATWHSDIGFNEEIERPGRLGMHPHPVPARPAHRAAGWPLLGFDVTDGGFLSGLSDCGFAAAERPVLVARWTGCLNRHHLFDELAPAFEFRNLSNTRVREHAPFFVVGLWLVREVR